MLLIALLAALAAGRQEARPTDARIQRAVERHLALEEAVPMKGVTVAVDAGVVSLVGSAPDLLAKERAIRVVENLRGVVGIVDRLELAPADVADRTLKDDVKLALMSDPATDSYEVDVRASEGNVTLEGKVQSYAEKELSGMVARGVRGVRSVDNRIAVSESAVRSADELRADVRRMLASEPYLNGELVDVEINGGTVTLRGAVGTLAQARRAERAAYLAGASAVTSVFDIQWWRDDARRPAAALKTDAEIKDAIRRTLAVDPRVYSFNIGIDVDAGIATLTGTVDNLRARTAAEEDAKNAIGAWRVRNRILVRPETMPTDFQVEKSVEDALRVDPVLQARSVRAQSRNNLVTLTGAVENYYERRRAEDVAASRSGVAAVTNKLIVKLGPPSPATDDRLESSIEDQYFWSLYVDADDVDVNARRGTAYLSGEVDDWQEHQAAVKNAFDGGARRVVSRMTVDGEPVAATFWPDGYILVD